MLQKLQILLILSLLTITSCKEDETIEPTISMSKHFLHLSHTRTNSNPLMDTTVENIDFNKFDMLLLGGDLAYLSSADDVTMNRIDSIFNVGDDNTLWALGNHDYTDLNKIEQYTCRPAYYASYLDGITFVVLDTQDSLSNIIGAQKEYLMRVLDTIQESTHLILLHHKLIWMYGNPVLESQISTISNGHLGDCFYCINPNNFNSEMYPELVEVKLKGIEVLCIGGDIGFQANEFEYLTPDGIHFLASGINSDGEYNKALLFHHDLENHSLTLLSDL